MKKSLIILLGLLLWVPMTHSQGTFIYDQQSSTESFPGEAIVGITTFQQPVGQSFTPSLNVVGFIRLSLGDGVVGNGLGSTVFVNLRTNSIAGPILASTTPVFLQDGFGGFGGFTNFFFSIPVSVAPGATYYFQPVIQSGDACVVGRFVSPNYPGGTEYINGQPGNNDLWFREGIYVVPEPSGLALTGCGIVLCGFWRKKLCAGGEQFRAG